MSTRYFTAVIAVTYDEADNLGTDAMAEMIEDGLHSQILGMDITVSAAVRDGTELVPMERLEEMHRDRLADAYEEPQQ